MNEKSMSVNGLGCRFNMPPALKSKFKDGEEQAHKLPPYKEVKPYVVDEYPACDSSWMNGSDKASSYFLPVIEGRSVWLDFNDCWSHTHHVAIVISIQKINPITGQKQDALRLEQYREKCPLHDEKFRQDRFCPKCKFTWPAQNYLSTTGTPHNQLWIDGFREADGKVKQYIITAEKIRGVAAQLIKEERVFAIGIAFFLSKEPKPRRPSGSILRGGNKSLLESLQDFDNRYPHNAQKKEYPGIVEAEPWVDFTRPKTIWTGSTDADSCKATWQNTAEGQMMGSELTEDGMPGAAVPDHMIVRPEYSLPQSGAKRLKSISQIVSAVQRLKSTNPAVIATLADQSEVTTEKHLESKTSSGSQPFKEVKTKQLEIGAGASIKQQVHADPNELDFWQDEPAGLIYINYALESEVREIIKQGKRDENTAGFLTGLNTGN